MTEDVAVELSRGDGDSPWVRARRVAERALLEEKRCITSRVLALLAGVDVDTARHVLRRLAKRYGLVNRGGVYCPPGGGDGAQGDGN